MTLPRRARLAAALWLVLAFLVWNVVFDRILVLAGRRYSYEATVAVRERGTYLRIDDWMQPAMAHGLWTASAVAIAIAVVGVAAVVMASRRARRRQM